tara:strand:+ start:2752 stop:3477 length:726 start_codon:yes stop_codon:yes gene_type:complete
VKDTLIVIPTYNEIDNIGLLIHDIFRIVKEVDILVVDDDSPDNTSGLVTDLQNKFIGKLFLLIRKSKIGLGKAYIDGFKWALKKSYKFIIEMDADYSHNPKDLIDLHKVCKNNDYDIVVGSRYINGINVVNWPFSRILLSYIASFYVRIITNMPVKDPTSGFVCYKRSVLESLNLNQIKFVGYAFQIEMKYKAFNKNYKIKEIPIIFTDRVRGVSKLTKGIIAEAVFGVLLMRFKKILGKL